MDHQQVFWGLILIGLFLLLGRAIKSRIALFDRLFLPSSIIAGFIALLAGPQVLGALAPGLPGMWVVCCFWHRA